MATACALACCDGELSQQPICPHWAHRRRWNHHPPAVSQSAQPLPLGDLVGSTPGNVLTLAPILAVAGASLACTEPTIGVTRQDGLRLLYPGKEHTCIGEMESGKSWLALACVVAELTKGNRVVYIHFEEANPNGIIHRLTFASSMAGATGLVMQSSIPAVMQRSMSPFSA